jgi:hypothetical protein
MTVHSDLNLVAALAQGTPERLIGTAESDGLDFKQSPYPLGTDKGKYDLCSDVTALANSQGGLIVCGVKAKRRSEEILEAASELTPFPRSLVNIETHQHVLDEYVRPLLQVELEWFDHPEESEKSGSYFVIQVPPLPAEQRYALVRRCITLDGKMREGVTIPLRNGDRTVHLPADDAYRLINDGLRMRELAHLGSLAGATPKGPTDADLDSDLESLEQAQDWDGEPTLWWQSAPAAGTSLLTRLYGPDGIEGALSDQDSLRGVSAFNFRTIDPRPRARDGALIVGDNRRAVLKVSPSGLVTAGALATGDMMGWAMDSRGYPNRLNVLAISEMTLEYFRIVDRFILPHAATGWRHRISARRFRGEAPRLLAQGANPGPLAFGGSLRQASADDWNEDWAATGNPETDAFHALERLYALFTLPASANPYVDAPAGRLDTELLLTGLRTAN